ncbi:MAG: hypothetical protein KDE19_10040, partial [Caldilineaceae bacterium]|nr:hypothetical protein [Caldilineaceae bacterium]
AWLSLDEYDDDPLLFLRYLVAAIQTAYPHFGETILAALQGAQVPAWLQLINMFVNDLAHLAQPLFLVLDDYHVITNTEIHKLLNRLLDYMPPAMHLVVLSRIEPPLALARLRVNREMQELHTADLAFSAQEIAEFLMQTVDRDLPPDLLQALYTNCEGWIAGLQLMVLSLPHHA